MQGFWGGENSHDLHVGSDTPLLKSDKGPRRMLALGTSRSMRRRDHGNPSPLPSIRVP